MTKRTKLIMGAAVILSLIGVLVAVIQIFGISGKPRSLKNAANLFATAIANVQNSDAAGYEVTVKEETTLFDHVFTMTSNKHISICGEDVLIEEDLISGSNEVHITEIYQDGCRYIALSGSNFKVKEDSDAFWQHHVPRIPVTADHYRSISGYAEKGEYVIQFSDPVAPESWMQTAANKLISAEATVRISKDYTILGYSFRSEFRQDEGMILQTMEYTAAEAVSIPQPEGDFSPIDDPEILRALEISTGYLLQTESFRSSYAETIFCQAFGDTRNRTIELEASNIGGWTSSYSSTIASENSANAGSVTTTKTAEIFKDGKLTVTKDDGTSTVTEEDPAAIQRRCRDLMVGTVIMPRFITNVSSSIDGNNIRYLITVNEEFNRAFSEEACMNMYQDGGILSAYASDHTTTDSGAYLTISRRTYIPVASGFHYSGIYTISDLPYELTFKADQLYGVTG